MLKVALVGCGYWGKNLGRVFQELGVLKIICDKDKEVLASLSQKYPNIKITDNIEEVLKDKSISALVIATPAITHYALAKKALLAKKHVFVEKPLALKIEEAEDLVRLTEKSKKILMVGHI